MKLRAHLLLLSILALVPVLAFAAIVVVLHARQERAAVERGLADTVRALRVALDRSLGQSLATLEALASAEHLDTPDLEGFYRRTVRVIPTQPGWRAVFLADLSGRQLFNTLRGFGEPLPSVDDRPYFQQVVRTGRPAVSDFIVGRITGLPTITVAVPVTRQGQLRYVLAAAFDLDRLSEVVQAQQFPPEWTSAILDRERRIIGRSRTPERFLGQPATAVLATRTAEAPQGTFWDVTKEGTPAFGVFSRSGLSGWTVVLGVPAETVQGPMRRSLALLAAAGAIFLALGLALAAAVTRRIAGPIAALSTAARALERGDALPPLPPVKVAELADLREALASAVAARRRAEESLGVTLRSIGDAVIATDTTGRVTFMNPVAEALTGWPEAEARGRPLAEVFRILAEDTRQPAEDPVGRVLREGTVVGLANHTMLLARDGRERPVDDSGAPIRDGSGHVVGVVLVFHDVTQRRRAEAQRAESEGRFRILADSAPVMVWMAGPDKLGTFFNKGWLDFRGRSLAQELGNGWVEGIHAADVARYLETYHAASDARRPFSLEYRLRRADGEYRWVVDSGVPRFAPDGGFEGFIGATMDIHDRKLAEEERARRLDRETRAREEAETSAEIVRRLMTITDAALARLPFDDLLRELLDRIRQLLAADTAAVLLVEADGQTLLARAARGLEAEVERGVRIPVGRGFAGRVAAERRPVLIDDVDHAEVLNPILREQGIRSLLGVPLTVEGRLIGVLHVGTRSPRRFTGGDADLLQLVADRVALAIEHVRLYEAERAARDAAEAASRAKDEFVATLSHELRTPLNAILGWARILATGAVEGPHARHAIGVIERNAQAQTQLINDLLDVSRIITGRLRLDVGAVDLPAVITAALDAVRPAAAAKGIALEFRHDPAAASIMGDPDRLQQVMWNLLSNAVKFTPREGRVEVDLRRREAQVEIEVRDTGIGIAPEVLPHVFERFQQADSTTTRVHGGLGLGLAIVRHLVELHGGTVWAESPGRGQGTSFTVRLPVNTVAVAPRVVAPLVSGARDATLPEAFPSLAGVRVLVVDDEADARELVTVLLESCRATVLAVPGAAAAVEALDRFRPDVVVSDIAMPGENGYELLRRIRRRPAEAGGQLPAIALTAHARGQERERAHAAGYDVYLAKPVEPVELARAVADLAGRPVG